MIRWLKDGHGDVNEEPVEMEPDHELLATASGQVTLDLGSREIYEIIRERFESRRERVARNTKELLDEVRQLMIPLQEMPVANRVTEETRTSGVDFTKNVPGDRAGSRASRNAAGSARRRPQTRGAGSRD